MKIPKDPDIITFCDGSYKVIRTVKHGDEFKLCLFDYNNAPRDENPMDWRKAEEELEDTGYSQRSTMVESL